MAHVLVKFNSAVIKDILLTKDVITFGRKKDNDIVIDHPAVSGHHGKIIKEGDQYSVEDLDSTNGTFVNGRRVKKSKLESKDNIRVAKHILEFSQESAEQEPTPKTEEPSKPRVKLEDFVKEREQAVKEESIKDIEKNLAGSGLPKKEEQKEILRKSLGLTSKPEIPQQQSPPSSNDMLRPPEPPKPSGDPGTMKIVSGSVDGQNEVELKGLVSYVGASDKALIKIKGFLAPDLACAISRKPDGYFLKAIKSGYPKVNGNSVKDQVFLENGALIECGGTNMVFYLPTKDKKK